MQHSDWTRLATSALRNWDAADAKPQLIKQRENAVFEIQLRNGDKAVLRIHRPGYHDDAAIKSETDWLNALNAGGLEVPTPVQTKNGLPLAHVKTSKQTYAVSVLSWIEGAPMGEDSTSLSNSPKNLEVIFASLGQALAKLHDISDVWQPPDDFKRHAWDSDGLLGENPFWGRFWELEELTLAQRDLLTHARDKAKGLLKTFSGSYGLIHADAIRENVLVQNNQARLIDFDDAGYGWRLFDLATVLFKNRDEPEYHKLKNSFLNGYCKLRPLTDNDLGSLFLFEALRSFTYLGWAQDRRGEADTCARIPKMISDTCEFAELLLDRS